MLKKTQVVMLPTTEKATLYLTGSGRLTVCSYGYVTHGAQGINQHLYFLSDEEIKEGDWIFDKEVGKIFPLPILKDRAQACNQETYKGRFYKIIATTDLLGTSNEEFHNTFKQKLHQPSQSFLEVFVREYNKGNMIKEVVVEYGDTCDTKRGNCECPEMDIDCQCHSLKPKIDSKNNIILWR